MVRARVGERGNAIAGDDGRIAPPNLTPIIITPSLDGVGAALFRESGGTGASRKRGGGSGEEDDVAVPHECRDLPGEDGLRA